MKIFCLASGGAASDPGELHCGGCRSGCGGVSEKTPHAKPRCRKSNPHVVLVIYTLKGPGSSPERRCFLLQWNWAALTWQPWGKGIPAWHTAATSSAGWGTVGTAGRSQGPGTARLPNQPLGSVGSPQSSLVTNSSSSCTKFSVGWAIASPRSGCVTSPKFPGTVVLARPRPIGRRFRSVEPGREHSSWTLIKFIRRKGKAKEETGRRVEDPGVGSSTRREPDCNHRAMAETHFYYQTLLVLHVLCNWSYEAPF